jgi:hypothetical protein
MNARSYYRSHPPHTVLQELGLADENKLFFKQNGFTGTINRMERCEVDDSKIRMRCHRVAGFVCEQEGTLD